MQVFETSRSISARLRLALLPLVALLAVQCSDTPTSPAADKTDRLVPSFAVAELSPINALEGTPLPFYCGSSSDAEGDALTCNWDFGNDGSLDAQCTTADGNCRWDFNHDGIFEGQRAGSFDYSWPDQTTTTVRLDVVDSNGDQSSTTAPVTVADVAPYIYGREPLVLAIGQTQRFHTRFSDPGADADWMFTVDFGDGTVVGPKRAPGPGIGIGQYYAYTTAGTYTVTVTVTDKDGVTSSYARTATVVPYLPPVADAGGPYATTEGATLELSSSETTDDQTALTFAWDFGDGSRSTLPNPSKIYRDNGNYSVRLIVTDPAGIADTAFTSVAVENVAPSGTPRVPGPREGATYVLQLNGSDPSNIDRSLLQYSFDCGQGAGPTAWSSTNNVTCPALPDQGTVNAVYTVRDKDGASTTFERQIVVINASPVVTLNAVSATTIPVGGTLQVEGSFTDAGAADGPFAYRFTFGEGESPSGTLPAPPTTPLTASHTYTRAGTYAVYLYVTDKDGASPRSTRLTVTVTP